MRKIKETKDNKLLEKMKAANLNPNEWVLANEGANKVKCYSTRQIKKLGENGIERVGTKKIDNTVLYNIRDILQYAANHQEKPILSPVWDELTFLSDEYFYPIVGYDYKYFISNKCRVINATKGQILTPKPQKDINGRLTGYLVVGLTKGNKLKTISIHRLVGKTQCPNAFDYDILHHINNTKHNGLYDNRASNILPIANEDIHNELHRLMNNDKKAYREMVTKLKKENKQKVYKIPDLDFESDANYNYWMLINASGYKEYQKSGDVPLDCILMQIAEAKE